MNNYKDHFRKMKSNSFPVRIKSETKKVRNSKRQDPPIAALKVGSLMALALSLSCYGFLYPEHVIGFVDRVRIFSSSEAKEAETPAEHSDHDKANTAASVKASEGVKKPVVDASVADNTNYIQHLDERKKSLDDKEKQLKELEEKLQLEKVALEKKVEELEQKRREIASKLEGRVQEDEERVKKLVDMYSNMKPQSAAQLIASLDEELAIHVLKRMKKQEAGNILNFMNPQKAKLLSEKYTGY